MHQRRVGLHRPPHGVPHPDDALGDVPAEQSKAEFQKKLHARYFGDITTEIVPAGEFYFAEDYHQQYLYKVPHGYCPDHSTGVSCPVGLLKADD